MAVEAAFTFRNGHRSTSPLSILFLVRLGKRVERSPRLTASEYRALLLDTYNCERIAVGAHGPASCAGRDAQMRADAVRRYKTEIAITRNAVTREETRM